jgi:putative ABC transport system permease protein
LGAAAIAWALAHFVFHLGYLPSPLLPWLGAALGIATAASVGGIGTSRVRRQPPLASLRGE